MLLATPDPEWPLDLILLLQVGNRDSDDHPPVLLYLVGEEDHYRPSSQQEGGIMLEGDSMRSLNPALSLSSGG